jgi:hypothetical protein
MDNAIFQDELQQGERILWSGQPETSAFFTGADFYLVPFSILWGGFAIFWEVMVIKTIGRAGSEKFGIGGALFGIPFVLMGLYFIFGRFFWKTYKKRRTYYAVTDKRVIVLTLLANKNVQADFIDRIPTMNLSTRPDGTGTITFGNTPGVSGMYGNTGMDFFGSFYGQSAPTFYDIKDADRVYRLVKEQTAR